MGDDPGALARLRHLGGHLRTGLLIALLLVLLALPAVARASTLAVLPLDAGSVDEAYLGLGDALAGMIVSDLARAEGLTLVERQRLDALVAELELAEGSFVDPETAGKLGRGLGAESVVLGSFSVVEGTLALDARVVRVESGEVLEGATASGPLSDFVSVEKELVEQLLPRLQARLDTRGRRAFYSSAPTEDWDAFTAFSRGQAKLSEGELEAARQAFEQALARDPDFLQAAEGLARLRGLVAKTRSADASTRENRYTAAEQAALKVLPDMRQRQGTPSTPEQLADTALRWTVLLNQRRDCDRYAEMRAYLEAVDWDPHAHGETQRGWIRAYRDRAEALGIQRWDKGVRHPDPVVHERLLDRDTDLWRDLPTFLFDGGQDGLPFKDQGLLKALVSCHPDEGARLRELAGWRRRLRATGQGEQRKAADSLSVLEYLSIAAAWTDAQDGRLRPETEKSLASLLAAWPDPDTTGHRLALNAAENVARVADRRDRWNHGRLGLDVETIRRRLEGIAAGEAPFTPDGAAWCAPGWEGTFRQEGERLRTRWDDALEDKPLPQLEIHWSARLVRVVGDMGCLEGVSARIRTFDDAADLARQAQAWRHPTRYDPSRCDGLMSALQALSAQPPPPAVSGRMTYTLYNHLMNLIQLRCLVEPR